MHFFLQSYITPLIDNVNDIEDRQCPCRILLTIFSFKLNVPRFASRYGQDFFSSSNHTRPALWYTQPPIYWVPEFFFLGGKAVGRGLFLLPATSVEIRNVCNYVFIFRVCVHVVERTTLPLTF